MNATSFKPKLVKYLMLTWSQLKAGKLRYAVPFARRDSDLGKIYCHGTFTEEAMLQGAWFHGAGSTLVRMV